MKRRSGSPWALGIVSGAALCVSLPAYTQVPKAPEAAKVEVPVQVQGRLAGGGNQGDLTARLIEQYRPTLYREYHFLRMVCGLSEEERKSIAQGAERAFKAAMRQYDEMRRTPQLRLAGAPPRVLPDPRKLIEEGLIRVAEEHLPAERVARYREELVQRALERRRVTIQKVVERLDHELFLSSDQRARLADTLSSRWDEAWFPIETMSINAEQYIGRIPSQHYIEVLNEDQRKLWEYVVRNRTPMVLGLSQVQMFTNDFPEDSELTEALAAAAAAR
jgi:hypothetical protein